jgi:hypothetical protein
VIRNWYFQCPDERNWSGKTPSLLRNINVKEKKMTLSPISVSKASVRLGALAAAMLTSTLLIGVAPQAHAATGPYYQVELAQPAAVEKQLIRGVFFKCDGTACRAPLASSAPKNVCISVARELGEVTSFKAGNRTFDATEIAACNEKMKTQMAKK